MKKNSIIISITALLAILAIWFYTRNNTSTISKELMDFAVEDTASITKLFLVDKSKGSILLEKMPTGQWQLNGKYQARIDAVKTLLTTICKIKVKEPVGKSAIPAVVKNLSSTGVKIEIYKGEKLVKLYYVGKETQDQTGTFMLLADPETKQNSSSPFVTYIPGFQGYLTPRYFTGENEWRDRSIIHYTPPELKSVKIEFTEQPDKSQQVNILGPNTFEVIELKTGTKIDHPDTNNIKQYLSYFRRINHEGFEEHINPDVKDSILKTRPQHILTIIDQNGKQILIKTYLKALENREAFDENGKAIKYDVDRMYALVNNVDFVTIQYYVFGILLQPVDYFKAAAPASKDVKKS